MVNKEKLDISKFITFPSMLAFILLCLLIGITPIYPYFNALNLPLEYSVNSVIFCTELGFFLLLLLFACVIWPCTWLIKTNMAFAKVTMSLLFVIFALGILYIFWTPNYTMAKFAGIIIKKAHLGNNTGTTFVMKSKDCKFLKANYKYAKYYLVEEPKENLCILENTHELYISNSKIQLLMMSPPNEEHCAILTINRENNSIVTTQTIDKDVVNKVLPEARFPGN